MQPKSWVPLQLVIHSPQFFQGLSFVGSARGEVFSGQVTPDGSRAHPWRASKAFPAGKAFLWAEREGTRQACLTVQDRRIKTCRGRPNFTPGAAGAELWSFSGIPSPRGRVILRRDGGCAGRNGRGNFLARLELCHLALQLGREILKNPHLLGPALHQ